jgi:hypothetical protein
MTFGSFGSISFLPLGAPDSLEFNDMSYYAKLEVLGEAPTLQWIYDDLTGTRISILVHQLWCVPSDVINSLQAMRKLHAPQPLTLNTENRGNFVIRTIHETDVWRADDSNIICAKLELNLLQWAGVLPQGAPATAQPATLLGANTGLPGASPLMAPIPAAGTGTSLAQVMADQSGTGTTGGAFLNVPLEQVTGLA